MKKRMLLFVLVVALVLGVSTLGSFAAVAQEGSVTAPTGFCKGGVAWVVRSQVNLTDPGCPIGGFVLTSDEWGKETFSTFAQAESFREGRDTTYWFEPQAAVATGVPTLTVSTTPVVQATVTVEVESVSAEVSMNWSNFCSGISPLLITGGGVLNVGLDSVDPPCDGSGTMVLVEPWRVGCGGEDVVHNSNCNVGMRKTFASWTELADWMVAGRWTEGSSWFRPSGWDPLDTVVSATPAATVTLVPATDNGEASWLRQLLALIEQRLAQLD